MEPQRCGLCDQPAGEDAQRVAIPPEERPWLEDDLRRRGHDPIPIVARALAQAIICARCAELPKAERRRLALEAFARVRRRFGLPDSS